MGKRHRDDPSERKSHKSSKKSKKHKPKKSKKHKKSSKGSEDYCSSTFFAGCREGDLKGAKRHLRHDPALMVRTNALGNSCLHLACEFGHVALVAFLYKKGHTAHLTRANHSGVRGPLSVSVAHFLSLCLSFSTSVYRAVPQFSPQFPRVWGRGG